MAIIATLTDWITLQGDGSNTRGATQPETDYLDVSWAQDGVLYVQINQVSAASGLNLAIETAPIREDALFLPVATAMAPTAPNTAPTVVISRFASATSTNPPLGAWLRWRLYNATSAWNITMKITAALNPNPASRMGPPDACYGAGLPDRYRSAYPPDPCYGAVLAGVYRR